MRVYVLIFILLTIKLSVFSQNCGLRNPSFETYKTCPTNHSQIDVVNSWVKTLPIAVATPDYYNYGCGLVGFTAAAGITVRAQDESYYTNCGRVGIFLNYNDGVQSPRYKEFIGQNVDLNSGVQYTLQMDVHKSLDNSTNDLERNLVVYGYNGFIPASHSNYCITGATVLASIPHATISSSLNTFTVNFTPTINYSHIIIGPACTGVDAVNTGYIFIDKVNLTSNDNNTLNPIITEYAYAVDEKCKCNYKAQRQFFYLKGTLPPSGAVSSWGQHPGNPEAVTFTNPTTDSTGIIGTGYLTPGNYQFTYSFTKGGCTITDTINITVIPPTLISINAGPDITVCNGNNDNGFPTVYDLRQVTMNATPTLAQINANNYGTWWSMIRQNGTEWVFPNSCVPANGQDEGDVAAYVSIGSGSGCGDLYTFNNFYPNHPDARFHIKNPQDTIFFIWHVEDPCEGILTDTIRVVMNDVDLGADLDFNLCPGTNDTILIEQLAYSSIRRLRDNANLNFTWSVTPVPVNLIGSATNIDSVYLVVSGSVTATYNVRLDVSDITNGCSWYDIKRIDINSITSPTVNAGPDITVCNGNNDLGSPTQYDYRYVTMNATPNLTQINNNSYGTWWSMIRQNGTEWVFPNRCVPYDGHDEGDVIAWSSFLPALSCGNLSTSSPYSSNHPDARFNIKNPQDTIYFIWHVSDPCAGVQADTIRVVMNDVDLGNRLDLNLCPGTNDTILIEQYANSNLRRLRDNPNLNFSWSVSPAPLNLIGSATNIDSVYLVVSGSINATYDVRLNVTDITNGCTWHDIKRVAINSIVPPVVSAGPDQTICNTVLSNFAITMNATPNLTAINSNSYQTWWSMIRSNGSLWVFPNRCIPSNGWDEGSVQSFTSFGSGITCGNLNTSSANYPNHHDARFYLDIWGNYTFIWNVINPCFPNDTIRDTVNINWGYDEPIVDAGPDQTPPNICNAIELQGNLSAASAGNTGCYLWRQISGPDQLTILDSTRNLAYVINLDSVTPGIYRVEYSLGCDPCIKRDTMRITVNPGITSGILDVTTSWDGISTLCFGDSVDVIASLAYSYAFYNNGTLVQSFSLDSTYSFAATLDTQEIIVLARNNAGNCLNNSDTSLLFFAVPCLTVDTVIDCTGNYCVDTSEMVAGYDTLVTCTGSLLTSQGGSVIINNICVTHIPSLSPWVYDSICLVLCDSLSIYCDTTLLIFCNIDTSITLYCNDTTVYLNGTGIAIIDTSFVLDSLISNNYPIDSVWLQRNTINCLGVPIDSIYVYARNTYGTIDSCLAYVNVFDTIAPQIICNNATLYLDPSGSIVIDTTGIIASLSDNCGIDSVWLSNGGTPLSCIDTGLYNVTIYARDPSGNIDSCVSSLTIVDSIAPNIICQSGIIYLDSTGLAYIDTSGLIISITDNCGVDSVWINSNDTLLGCLDTGLHSITIYVTDVSGNIDSCQSVLTVLDTINPYIICQTGTVYLDPTGILILDTTGLISIFGDNCGVSAVWVSPSDTLKTCTDTGNRLITIYIRDVSGNIDSCVNNIYISDTNSPVALCMDTTIYLNNLGVAIIDSSYIDNGSFGSCFSIMQMLVSKSTFNCADLGINLDTLTVISANGKTNQCVANVTVLDSIAPVFTCPNDTTLYLTGSCNYTIPNYVSSFGFSDNCGSVAVTVTQNPIQGTVVSVNTIANDSLNIPIIITINDGSNMDSCIVNINLVCFANLLIPGFISPNGDGQNDTWEIIGIEHYPGNSIKIFNRWGQILFSMINYDNSWYGQVTEGSIFMSSTDGAVPDGTYFYIVDKNDGSDPILGFLQLIR